MSNPFKQSLKQTATLLLTFQLLLIMVLGGLTGVLYLNQLNLAQSRDAHFKSYLLADELRQSSDDLTRMVRAYVATGNLEFEREYWTILDIRDGKLPRPTAYNRIYWDFFATTGQKPRLDGGTISLRELMIKAGFTSEELAKLNLAQKNSDDLVYAETVAMNAMKGLFEDPDGKFTIKKTPDPALANRLVNDENYYKAKAEIMRPVDDFYQMFETRTEQAVNNYLQLSNILFLVAIALGIVITLIAALSLVIIRRQIVKREQSETALRALQANLESKVKERTTQLSQSEKNATKALAEMERLNRLMVGRELKMIELKRSLRECSEKN